MARPTPTDRSIGTVDRTGPHDGRRDVRTAGRVEPPDGDARRDPRGHPPRAALIDPNATADRDQAIAAALSRLATGDVTDAEQQAARVRHCTPEAGHVRGLRARSGHGAGVRSCLDRPILSPTAPDLRLLRERATGIEPAFSAWKADPGRLAVTVPTCSCRSGGVAGPEVFVAARRCARATGT